MPRLIKPTGKVIPAKEEYAPIGHILPHILRLDHFRLGEDEGYDTLDYRIPQDMKSRLRRDFDVWTDSVSLPYVVWTTSFCGGVWMGHIDRTLTKERLVPNKTLRDRLMSLCGFMLYMRASNNKGFVFAAVPVSHWDKEYGGSRDALSIGGKIVRRERYKPFTAGEALTRLGFQITATAVNPNSRNNCHALLAIISESKFKDPQYWTELVDTYLAELGYEFYEGPLADAPF